MTRSRSARFVTAATTALVLAVTSAAPAWAQTGEASIDGAITRLHDLIVRVALTAATAVLALAGLRYVTANGNTERIEQAKTAFKGAAVGYAVVILAGGFMALLRGVVGG
jgi:hypothetical protein